MLFSDDEVNKWAPCPFKKLKRALHPLDEEKKSNSPALTQKVDRGGGKKTTSATKKATAAGKKLASRLKVLENGTVVKVSDDGSKTEIRPDGMIISYNPDGTVRYFRIGCWSG